MAGRCFFLPNIIIPHIFLLLTPIHPRPAKAYYGVIALDIAVFFP